MNIPSLSTRKFQFSVRTLLITYLLVGLVSGVFARALHANAIARRQAVTLELQSAKDWLQVLISDREQLVAEFGPRHNKVLHIDQMILSSKTRVQSLTAIMESQN